MKSFANSMLEFLREDRCLSYDVYQEYEKKNIFSLVGEYDTHDAMVNHFQTKNFGVLIGAASVLGKSFKIQIAEVLQTGGLEQAKALRCN